MVAETAGAGAGVVGVGGGGAAGSMSVGSSHTARSTWSGPGGPVWVRLRVNAVVVAGSRQVRRWPRGRPRSPVRRGSVQTVWRVPVSSSTVTVACSVPWPSRQSWGSSIARAVSHTSPDRPSGMVSADPACMTSPRPNSPSGSTTQRVPSLAASNRPRNADTGNRTTTGARAAASRRGRRPRRWRRLPARDRVLMGSLG